VIFWQKNIGAKGSHKMLMKLTPIHLLPHVEKGRLNVANGFVYKYFKTGIF